MSLPSRELQTLKAEFFRALGHPVRIRLLEALVSKGPASVQDLQRQLRTEQPIVSQQLARLRAHGMSWRAGRDRSSSTVSPTR